jgi:anhydro-N-acetylmuramic acid kinase
MVYRVIGLMSGSSLDGLDIAHVQLEEVRGQWSYSILHADCVPYPQIWTAQLRHAPEMKMGDFLKLHTGYGRYIGEKVNEFVANFDLVHQVHFIASHGHTVFHEPQNHATFQVGDGASIAAITGLPVVSDLRAMDVALGGQGAPIVPICDKLLFGGYDYLLNIGGIANITVQATDKGPVAFDICPANQALNILAGREGKVMDEGGAMAAQGSLIEELLEVVSRHSYYQHRASKSLSNEMALAISAPLLKDSVYENADLLHTAVVHIAAEVARAVSHFKHNKEQTTMLVTGGGALNTFLIERLQDALVPMNVKVTVPDDETVIYKEALAMALIGALRWREEVNVLGSVTGAVRDSAGGALWLP